MGMESTTSPVNVTSFRGLNTKLSDVSISEREATALKNVNISKEKLECRYGSIVWSKTQLIEGGSSKAVTGLYQGALSGDQYRLVCGGTKIYSATSGGVLTDITGALTITDSANANWQFVTFIDGAADDVIIGANGTDAPFKWTGSGSASALSGVPGNFKYLLVRKNRLWGTIDDYLYVSSQLDGETYDLLSGLARFKSQGFTTTEITGIADYGDSLVVFKEDAIWMMSGESFDDAYIQKVVSGDGCISGYSIKEVKSTRYGNILVFVDRRGHLKGFNGTQNLIHLTDDFIPDEIASYNSTRAPLISAVNYKNKDQYIINATYGSGTAHDRILCHDYFIDGIDGAATPESTMLVHQGINACSLGLMNIGSADTLMIGTYDGWVLQYESGSYDVDSAFEIDASPTGAVRSSNVVTITTLLDHGLSTGDVVTIESVTDSSFDGEFTVTSTPTSTTFTYAQTDADATSGAGKVVIYADIDAYWQSKKITFGNAALQKQLNDFDLIFTNNGSGQITTTVTTDRSRGVSTDSAPISGALYGQATYGQARYGGRTTSYYGVRFDDMSGDSALVGRFFTVKFQNVDSFRFGIEEFVMGVTTHGYQAEYQE